MNSTGGQEDQQHGDDVLIAHALAHDRQLLVKAETLILQTGNQNRRQKRNDDRHFIKAHLDFQSVLKSQAQAQINGKKHTNGQQCNGIPLFHIFHPLKSQLAGKTI